jgi:hypothetical protein
VLDKPPASTSLGELLTWMWVVGLSLIGGFVSFTQKLKAGHVRAWNINELVGECVTSAFVGVITFNLCQWQGFPPSLTAALVGIVSHMGSRALFKAESYLNARIPTPEPPPLSEVTHDVR